MKSSSGSSLAEPFNHDHLVLRPGKHQVKLAVFTLGIGRVDDELAVNAAHADGAHGFGKGEVGNDAGGGSAVDAQNVRFIFTVGGKQKGDHLRIIEVALGEHRAQGAVRHAARQDFLFRGAAFTLEVTAGEHARGSGLFLVFHGPGGRRSGLP